MEVTHMDPFNQISIESFSHGWLTNINPIFDLDRLGDSLRRSFEALDGGSFIEMDPDFFSMRWTDSTRFDFSLPSSCESSNLLHADQIFSNGQLLPLSSLKQKDAACFSSDSALTRSVSIGSSKTLLSERNLWDDSASMGTSPTNSSSSYSMPLNSGAKKLTQVKKLRKYLNFLIPLYKQVKKLKITSLRTTRSCGDSPTRSVGMRNEFSDIELDRKNRFSDWEFESSIHDAVLHCKKSIANSNAEA